MEHKTSPADELMRRLDAFWGRAYDICNEFYDEYDRGYEELENEPFECDLSAARMRAKDGGGIAIDYNAAYVYDACTASCAQEEDGEAQCDERCLEEAEDSAKSVLDAYRRVIDKWAKKRGVSYTEELKRGGLDFTLAVRI
jgi:hypothetical protein